MPKLYSDLFWQKVDKTPASGCWIWQAYVEAAGYGIYRGRKAHRVAYELAFGPIPKGASRFDYCVCHRCDDKLCVNPAHLFLGSQYENVQDRNAKGRTATGEAHGRVKLTEEKVAEARRLYASGEFSHRELAERFGVKHPVLMQAIKGRTWKTVPGALS